MALDSSLVLEEWEIQLQIQMQTQIQHNHTQTHTLMLRNETHKNAYINLVCFNL